MHTYLGVRICPVGQKTRLLVLHLPAAAQGDDMERRLKDLPEWVLSVTNNLLLHRSWRQPVAEYLKELLAKGQPLSQELILSRWKALIP